MCLSCMHARSASVFHPPPAQSETKETKPIDGQGEAQLRDTRPEAGIQLQTSNLRGSYKGGSGSDPAQLFFADAASRK